MQYLAGTVKTLGLVIDSTRAFLRYDSAKGYQAIANTDSYTRSLYAEAPVPDRYTYIRDDFINYLNLSVAWSTEMANFTTQAEQGYPVGRDAAQQLADQANADRLSMITAANVLEDDLSAEASQ
jgi:hypothetical protein